MFFTHDLSGSSVSISPVQPVLTAAHLTRQARTIALLTTRNKILAKTSQGTLIMELEIRDNYWSY